MSTRMMKIVNEECESIDGNPRLILNHLAYRVAYMDEDRDLFLQCGRRKDSLRDVLSGQAWITADEWLEYTGMDDQSRNHAVNKLVKWGMIRRIGKAHAGEAQLYEIGTREELRAGNAMAAAEKARRSESQRARHARTRERERLSEMTGSTVINDTQTQSEPPPEKVKPINNDTQCLSEMTGSTVINDTQCLSEMTPPILERLEISERLRLITATPPQAARPQPEPHSETLKAMMDGLDVEAHYNTAQHRLEPVEKQTLDYWTDLGCPALTPLNETA